jgi:hypothetical protein
MIRNPAEQTTIGAHPWLNQFGHWQLAAGN